MHPIPLSSVCVQVVGLGCTPAEVTWEAGVDALALGTTKGGTLAAEAMVFFNPAGTQPTHDTKRGYYLYIIWQLLLLYYLAATSERLS
eukprot:COSAG06_NODE_7952_length_2324_cov_12.703371_2_plen_88_part_00